MNKSKRVRSARALPVRECAHRGYYSDERVRALYHQAQDERAQRVRAELFRLFEIAEEILAEGDEP